MYFKTLISDKTQYYFLNCKILYKNNKRHIPVTSLKASKYVSHFAKESWAAYKGIQQRFSLVVDARFDQKLNHLIDWESFKPYRQYYVRIDKFIICGHDILNQFWENG